MKINYNSWSDISINKYLEMQNLLNEEGLTIEEQNISLVAMFTDSSVDDVYNWKADEFEDTLANVNALFAQETPQFGKHKVSSIKIDDTEYNVITDIKNFTVAQYIDFQNYLAFDITDNSLAKMLSTLIVPKGKIYGEDYDVAQLINTIGEKLDIITAKNISFFFQKKLKNSTRHSLTFLQVMMKMMMWKMGIPRKMRKQINHNMTQIIGCIS